MPTPPDSELPREMDIAYFVHLHLDTLAVSALRSDIAGHRVYRVEGKPRPMLVTYVLPEKNGLRWFRVLPITTKGEHHNHQLKDGHFLIGKLRGAAEVSYIKPDDSRKLPENMLHHKKGLATIIDSMDRLRFNELVNLARNYMMGGMARLDS